MLSYQPAVDAVSKQRVDPWTEDHRIERAELRERRQKKLEAFPRVRAEISAGGLSEWNECKTGLVGVYPVVGLEGIFFYAEVAA